MERWTSYHLKRKVGQVVASPLLLMFGLHILFKITISKYLFALISFRHLFQLKIQIFIFKIDLFKITIYTSQFQISHHYF